MSVFFYAGVCFDDEQRKNVLFERYFEYYLKFVQKFGSLDADYFAQMFNCQILQIQGDEVVLAGDAESFIKGKIALLPQLNKYVNQQVFNFFTTEFFYKVFILTTLTPKFFYFIQCLSQEETKKIVKNILGVIGKNVDWLKSQELTLDEQTLKSEHTDDVRHRTSFGDACKDLINIHVLSSVRTAVVDVFGIDVQTIPDLPANVSIKQIWDSSVVIRVIKHKSGFIEYFQKMDTTDKTGKKNITVQSAERLDENDYAIRLGRPTEDGKIILSDCLVKLVKDKGEKFQFLSYLTERDVRLFSFIHDFLKQYEGNEAFAHDLHVYLGRIKLWRLSRTSFQMFHGWGWNGNRFSWNLFEYRLALASRFGKIEKLYTIPCAKDLCANEFHHLRLSQPGDTGIGDLTKLVRAAGTMVVAPVLNDLLKEDHKGSEYDSCRLFLRGFNERLMISPLPLNELIILAVENLFKGAFSEFMGLAAAIDVEKHLKTKHDEISRKIVDSQLSEEARNAQIDFLLMNYVMPNRLNKVCYLTRAYAEDLIEYLLQSTKLNENLCEILGDKFLAMDQTSFLRNVFEIMKNFDPWLGRLRAPDSLAVKDKLLDLWGMFQVIMEEAKSEGALKYAPRIHPYYDMFSIFAAEGLSPVIEKDKQEDARFAFIRNRVAEAPLAFFQQKGLAQIIPLSSSELPPELLDRQETKAQQRSPLSPLEPPPTSPDRQGTKVQQDTKAQQGPGAQANQFVYRYFCHM